MPVLSLSEDLEFFYTDSGRPFSSNYRTLILIHGHTFHSGAFQRLLPIAAAHGIRVICINRREYPGTTPFSSADLKVFAEGSEAERARVLEQQGIDLGLFVTALIKECALPEEGGIAIAGWSLGNTHLLSFVSSINLLPIERKKKLQAYIKEIIMWDPPSHGLGINASGYVPLWDETLAPEVRGQAFGVWVASYFKHGELSTRDFTQLEQRNAIPTKKPTVANMTHDELFSMVDFAAGDKCETVLVTPPFASVLARQTEKALFDPAVRDTWKKTVFWHMHGDANAWNVVYAAWNLEERANRTKTPINFKIIRGVNHFPMWDAPEMAFSALLACMQPYKPSYLSSFVMSLLTAMGMYDLLKSISVYVKNWYKRPAITI